ncbi:MAG: DUF456 domain-containing protein [Prevotellaceae bacterium]|jgi:uncharacterized protein YqgC (DUF456 family)|nr:DUF456 domain-containing protein [Prevotellaceae bacterium]
MEPIIVIIGLLLLVVAFLGCFVPMLPGPVFAYAALLLRHFCSESVPSNSIILLIAMGGVLLAVLVLDYLIPGWVTLKAGGSKYGARGALIGMIAGILLTPVGMLLGMFLGALIGELMYNNSVGRAFTIACYSFAGFLLTVGVKFIYCIIAAAFFIFNSITPSA